MNSMGLDWGDVAVFLAVAETGSLSAAARVLGKSQPTVGRQIDQFSGQFSQPLFERHPKGMRLTDLGHQIKIQAEQVKQAMAQVELIRAGQDQDLSGRVRITAPVMMAHYVLPDVVTELRRRYPAIKLDIVASDAQDNLTFRQADIALRMVRPDQNDLIMAKLGTVEMGAFATRDYLDRRGIPQSPNDLFTHDLIGYDKSTYMLDQIARLGHAIPKDFFAIGTDDQALHREFVASGAGIGFFPLMVGQNIPNAERIMPNLPIPSLTAYLVCHQKIRTVPKINVIWRALVDRLSVICAK